MKNIVHSSLAQASDPRRAFRRTLAVVALVTGSVASTTRAAPPPSSALPLLSTQGLETRFSAQDLSHAPGILFLRSGANDSSDGGGDPSTSGADPRRPAPRFGQAGSLQFNLFGDYTNDFDGDWSLGGQFGLSWFFVDNLSLDVQLEQWGIWQSGTNAYAIGPALLVRWHLFAFDEWSLYIDAGCGFFYATNPVPSDGTRFNFTPRAGFGASIALSERARIMTGVRWFHISNANTGSPNPGRDSLEVYAGLSLPF